MFRKRDAVPYSPLKPWESHRFDGPYTGGIYRAMARWGTAAVVFFLGTMALSMAGWLP